MAQHQLKGSGAPTVVPPTLMCHYLDETNGTTYISIGTSSVNDWIIDAGAGSPTTFTGLSDTPSTYSGQAGLVATVNATEDGITFASGSGGSSNFLGLTDTPSTYSGQAGKVAVVNSGETALEFMTSVDSVLNASGQIITYDSVLSEPITIDIGADGQVLTVNADDGQPEWQTNYGAMTASTSLLSGCLLTVNSGDNTKFDISAGLGIHVDNTTIPGTPEVTIVEVPEQIGVDATLINVAPFTVLSINSDGTLNQRPTPSTPSQKRDAFDIGGLIHSSLTIIESTFGNFTPGYDTTLQLEDLLDALGFFNISGNTIYGISGSLQLHKNAGTGFGPGANTRTDAKNPHYVDMPELSPVTITQVNQNGAFVGSGNALDPTVWDDNGSLNLVPSGEATISYLYLFPNNTITRLLPQETYSSYAEATNILGTEVLTVPPVLGAGILMARVVLAQDASDFDDDLTAKLYPIGGFSPAGGPTLTTLQEAYDASLQGQIYLNSHLGGLQVFDTDSGINDHLLAIKQFDGTDLFTVDDSGAEAEELTLKNVTGARALYVDTGNTIQSSATTQAELGYVSGVTSSIQTQLDGKEPGLGNPSTDGYILSSTTAGVRSWVAPTSGGATTWLQLTDTPSSYSANLPVRANSSGNGLEFYAGDLQAAYNLSDGDIALDGTIEGISIFDTVSPLNASLFRVTNNAGNQNLLNVTSTNVHIRALNLDLLTHDTALYVNSSGTVSSSTTSSTQLNYLNTTTSNVQTQLDSKMTNPMTTHGDIIFQNSSGNPDRLGVGVNNNFLATNGSSIGWTNVGADQVAESATRVFVSPAQRTQIGTNTSDIAGKEDSLGNPSVTGYVLSSDTSGNRSWVENSGSGMTDPMTTRGDIIYRDSTNTTNRLGLGEANQVLGSDGFDVVWWTLNTSQVAETALRVFVTPDEKTQIGTNETDIGNLQTGKEDSLGNPSTDGYILSSTSAGVRSWIAPSGGGSSTWLGLTDTPGSFTASQSVRANSGGNALEFYQNSLQQTYSDSTTGDFTLDDSIGGVHIHDSLSGVGQALLKVTDNGLTTDYLSVEASGVTVSNLKATNLTNSRVVVSASGTDQLVSASTTTTEVNYLSGTTSNVQGQLDDKEPGLGDPTTDGYILSSTTAGVRSWVAPGSGGGMTDPMTTRGDIIYRDASNTTNRLGLGGSGQFLRSDGTDLNWFTVTSDNIPEGSTNLYLTSAERTQIGTNTDDIADKEDSLGNPSGADMFLTSTTGGVRSWEMIHPAAQYNESTGGITVNTTGIGQIITFDSADFADTGFSNSNGTITIANAGRYNVSSFVSVNGTTNNYRWVGQISIYKNISTSPEIMKQKRGGYIRGNATSGAFDSSIDIDHDVTVAAGDTITITVARISSRTGNGVTVANMSSLKITRLR